MDLGKQCVICDATRTAKAAIFTDDPEKMFLTQSLSASFKKIFNQNPNTYVCMILQPEGTDMYNNGMNNSDIVDQPQGTYHLDYWIKKLKQLWSIWMWELQVLLVNVNVRH